MLGWGACGPAPAREPAANAALLVASAELKGSIFASSVVMVMRVPGEETIGVILNRPGAEAAPGPVLPEVEGRVPGFYRGGPLSPGAAFAIADTDQAVPGTLEAIERIRFAAGTANVRALLSVPGMRRCKVFMGYAGWAPGQLAQEIAAGFWDARKVLAQHLFDPDPGGQWRRLNGSAQVI